MSIESITQLNCDFHPHSGPQLLTEQEIWEAINSNRPLSSDWINQFRDALCLSSFSAFTILPGRESSLFYAAVGMERLDIVDLLIQKAKSLNILPESLHLKNESTQQTALHSACDNGNREMILLLLNAGASLIECNTKSHTPLDSAILAGQLNAVNTLLQYPMEEETLQTLLHPQCEKRQSPLHLACKENDRNILYALLDAGACLYMRDHNDRTPLNTAIDYESTIAVEAILTYPMEQRALKDLLGSRSGDTFITALHQASILGNLDILQMLLEKGAPLEKLCLEGHTAFDFAVQSGALEVMESLVDYAKKNTPSIPCGSKRAQPENGRSQNDSTPPKRQRQPAESSSGDPSAPPLHYEDVIRLHQERISAFQNAKGYSEIGPMPLHKYLLEQLDQNFDIDLRLIFRRCAVEAHSEMKVDHFDKAHDLFLNAFAALIANEPRQITFIASDLLAKAAEALLFAKNYPEALNFYQQALVVFQATTADESAIPITHLANAGYTHLMLENNAEAADLLEYTLAQEESKIPDLKILDNAALANYKCKRYLRAAELYNTSAIAHFENKNFFQASQQFKYTIKALLSAGPEISYLRALSTIRL